MDIARSYVVYFSYGYKKFDIPFEIENNTDITIYVNGRLQFLNQDYTLNLPTNIEEISKNPSINFFNPLGSNINEAKVIITRNINPQRLTNFSLYKYVDVKLLDVELDNIIKNQQFLKDAYSLSVKHYDVNQNEVLLPPSKVGSAIIWQADNTLGTSKYDIDNVLDKLLNYINNPDSSKHPKDPNNDIPTINIYNAKDIQYTATTIKDSQNVEEALHNLVNSNNIVFKGSKSVYKELEYINVLLEDIYDKLPNANQNNELYVGAKHCIISGEVSLNGDSNFLQYANEPFKINVISNVDNPLKICFTQDNNIYVKNLENSVNISCVGVVNKIIYIYATKEEDKISIGYTLNNPYYLYHNPILYPDNSNIRHGKYKKGSDFFYVPTLTMYNENNVKITRVYIGQVKFDSNGVPTYLNSYCFGDSMVQDIEMQTGKKYSMVNKLGCSNLLLDFYLKENLELGGEIYYEEDTNYSLNVLDIDRNINVYPLRTGVTYNISSQNIWGVCGNPNSHILYSTDNNASMLVSGGTIRIICKRCF